MCASCKKDCGTKAGLTQHARYKHPPGEASGRPPQPAAISFNLSALAEEPFPSASSGFDQDFGLNSNEEVSSDEVTVVPEWFLLPSAIANYVFLNHETAQMVERQFMHVEPKKYGTSKQISRCRHS